MESKKKQFTYRGKTLEELKKLDVREFAKYLKSRERRTVLRQFQKIERLLKKIKQKSKKSKPIRTHERNLVIVPEMVNEKIDVYNGNKFMPVRINEKMLGHRLGEFALTRGKVKHSKAGVGATKSSRAKSVR